MGLEPGPADWGCRATLAPHPCPKVCQTATGCCQEKCAIA